MVERYKNPMISPIFSDKSKLELWQATELALIKALENLKKIPEDVYPQVFKLWQDNPIDIEWWKARDKEIHHDLNAFLDERLRYLPTELHQYVHKNITSYDTEEPAFARMLIQGIEVVKPLYEDLEETLIELALKYRYTIMNARTHGQEAEIQSFGARCLTWIVELRMAHRTLESSLGNLGFSKMSGAIGKYGSFNPEVEIEALKILGFTPLYGATQIMPRIMYVPIAQGLSGLCQVMAKIGLDIRLAARSGRPLMQEPFKKKQKGSSAMPHKKNTIRTEQLEGMARMAKKYAEMAAENTITWEERAIEQSSVERVCWQDLFHVVTNSLKVLTEVIRGLKVYPDNMLQEIYELRGAYASSEAKEFLKEHLAPIGLDYEDVYRIIQIACFNVFEPSGERLKSREIISQSLNESGFALRIASEMPPEVIVSIEEFIPAANLRLSEALDVDQITIDIYNEGLDKLFSDVKLLEKWKELFKPEFLLRNENILYKKIIRT